LNIDVRINNETQDCKIGMMCRGEGIWGKGRVNGRDEGDGIWLMGFIPTYKIEQ
jgi:hypothetical protein